MNLRRGAFRLWIVATVLWMFVFVIWLAIEGSETHQTLVEANCEPLIATDEWYQCYKKYRGPESGGTWFTHNLSSPAIWALMLFPPLIIGVIGIAVLKIGAWVVRGFRNS